MAKTTRHGGASNRYAEATEVKEWPGSSSSVSSEKPETSEADSSLSLPEPAPTTVSLSPVDQEEFSFADLTVGNGQEMERPPSGSKKKRSK